jgi:Uma2 family endonuclease
MSDHSEPEPDICLVQRSRDDYQAEHPTPKDTLLVVEVSHSSLAFDLGRKLQLYAKSNIAEYWVIDVERKVAVVHRAPMMEKFDDVTTLQSDAKIAPLAFPESELDLAWLFR